MRSAAQVPILVNILRGFLLISALYRCFESVTDADFSVANAIVSVVPSSWWSMKGDSLRSLHKLLPKSD
jgi:hypothetical protein